MRTNDIKRLVEYYIKKFNTRNPFELANCLNVEVQLGPLGSQSWMLYVSEKSQVHFPE